VPELERPAPPSLVIVGRSSSHFTRVTRIFAAELQVEHGFHTVPDLMSLDAGDYAGNPALKLPILRTVDDTWFGALNICRELARRSPLGRRVLWPEELDGVLLCNAQELVTQAMASEVAWILSGLGGTDPAHPHRKKLRASLENSVAWLESHVPSALAALPPSRDMSYLEVTLFCLVTHLEFREVLSTASYPELSAFCLRFGERAAAAATAYHFDA